MQPVAAAGITSNRGFSRENGSKSMHIVQGVALKLGTCIKAGLLTAFPIVLIIYLFAAPIAYLMLVPSGLWSLPGFAVIWMLMFENYLALKVCLVSFSMGFFLAAGHFFITAAELRQLSAGACPRQ